MTLELKCEFIMPSLLIETASIIQPLTKLSLALRIQEKGNILTLIQNSQEEFWHNLTQFYLHQKKVSMKVPNVYEVILICESGFVFPRS